ncbi:MAG: hypothetical protein N3A59_06000 [Thermodesulfovibrionales bacterium]|nr:hypothetical protein [Thermodesulfovibrionales bacterium]
MKNRFFPIIYTICAILLFTLYSCEKQENTKTFGGSFIDLASNIEKTFDNGFIIAGITYSYGAGLSDALVLKTDQRGNLLWYKTYGGLRSDTANSIKQTSDGGFIVAGSTFSYGNGLSDAWILKLNPQGDLLWHKTYGEAYRDEAYNIKETTDKGYIIAGYTSESLDNINFWVFKTDIRGTLLWQKKLGNENFDEAYAARQTSDGGYIAVGYATPVRTSFSDIWVVKLNSKGHTEWEKIFGGSRRDIAAYVIEDALGDYIIAASTTSYGSGNYDLWILKLDNKGNYVW